MHLITPLAAGIRGAENGTAEFYSREGTLRVSWWTDFEGVTQQDASSNLQLDANGGGTAYVNEMCRVVVKSSAGVVVRTFVAGAQDNSVEVISPSFTGTDYQSLQANLANKPVVLGTVMDRLITSFGATNFQVTFRGAATNLKDAVAHIAFYNVQAPEYGAVGDGVADDSGAIQAAIDDAFIDGGGIVFFPPGTYNVSSTTIVLQRDVSLLAAGADSVELRTSAPISPLLRVDGGDGRWRFVDGLTFSVANAGSGRLVLCNAAGGASYVHLRNCVLGGSAHTSSSGPLENQSAGELWVDGCHVNSSSDSQSAIISGNQGTVRLTNSRVTTPTGFNPSSAAIGAIETLGATLQVHGCTFDMSAGVSNDSGAVAVRAAASVFASNNLLSGVADSYMLRFTAALSSSYMVRESGNHVSGGAELYNFASTPTSTTAHAIHLGSRMGRRVRYVKTADTVAGTLTMDLMNYEIAEVDIDDAVTFNPTTAVVPLEGMQAALLFTNTQGATGGAQFLGTIRVNGGVLSLPDDQARVYYLRSGMFTFASGGLSSYWIAEGGNVS